MGFEKEKGIIPTNIWNNKFKHTKPFGNDEGFRFIKR